MPEHSHVTSRASAHRARGSSSPAAASRRSRPCSPCATSSASRCRSRCSRPSAASSTARRRSPGRSGSAARADRPRRARARPRGGAACAARSTASSPQRRVAVLARRRGARLRPPRRRGRRAPSEPAVPGALTFAGPGQAAEVAAILDRVERGEARRLVFAVPAGADVVAARLRARDDGRRRPARPRGRARHAGHRHARARAAPPLRRGGRRRAARDARRARHRAVDAAPGRWSCATASSTSSQGRRCAPTRSSACPRSRDRRSPACPPTRAASSPSTRTAASAVPRASTPRATRPRSRSSRAASPPSRPTRSPRRSPPTSTSCPTPPRSGPCCAGCCSPAARRCTCAPSCPATRSPTARRLRGEVSGRALWWPPGKVAGRYLAPYLGTARPVDLGSEPLRDRAAARRRAAPPPTATRPTGSRSCSPSRTRELGDYRQALHALDAAAALAGGVLPDEWVESRERWQRELAPQG